MTTNDDYSNRWHAYLDQFELSLTQTQSDLFEQYAELIRSWNQNINLTRITEKHELEIRHFLDSLSFALFLRKYPIDHPFHLIDVGTGAGLPGVPIKIVYPGVDVTLADSVGKKTTFLTLVGETLGLQGMRSLHARAETIGRDPAHREQYDVVVARSVAYMATLAEYLIPLCRPGGYIVAYKGNRGKEEVLECQSAIEVLGGKLIESIPVPLPEVEDQHFLVVIKKVGETPAKYPRKAGIPTKRPLA